MIEDLQYADIADKCWFLSYLSDHQLSLFFSNCHIEFYNAKRNLFYQNTKTSNFLFLINGLVKTYKEDTKSRTLVINFISSGHFIALPSILCYSTHNHSAQIVSDSEILVIDGNFFRKIIHENDTLSLKINKLMHKNITQLTDKLYFLAYTQLPGKVATLLLFFSEVIFQNHIIVLPVTRRELAEFSGTTTSSIIKTLSDLKNDGVIDIEDNRITIINKDLLKRLCEIG